MKRPLFVSCLAIVLLSTLSDLATEFVEIGRGLYVEVLGRHPSIRRSCSRGSSGQHE